MPGMFSWVDISLFSMIMCYFINKYSGQENLIDKYYAAIQIIVKASANSQSTEFKKRVRDILHTVDGGETVTDGITTWKEGGFNPFKPFQKKVLRQKIAQLSVAIKELGIKR